MFDFHCGNNNLLKDRISELYCVPEEQYVKKLIALLEDSEINYADIDVMAGNIKNHVKNYKLDQVEQLMSNFNLSTEEGIALLCLGESLLKIPDKYTQNLIITDTIYRNKWLQGNSQHMFTEALKWSLFLSGQIMAISQTKMLKYLLKPISLFGEPIVRATMKAIIDSIGQKFILGENIHQAVHKSKNYNQFSYSYSIVQKRSVTKHESYLAYTQYLNSLHTLGYINKYNSVRNNSISIKMSSLFHKYQFQYATEAKKVLFERLKEILILARKYNIIAFIEAEESDTLELSLEILEMLLMDREIRGSQGIGFVIEAAQKRSVAIVDYLIHYAHRFNTKLFIKLSIGIHWRAEIFKAQNTNLAEYPVFTKTEYINIAYLTCALKMLDHIDAINVGFETDNPILIPILCHMFEGKQFELHFPYGVFHELPEFLYKEYNIKCRIFGPIGKTRDVLPILLSYQLQKPVKFNFSSTLWQSKNLENISANILKQAKESLLQHNISLPPYCYGDFKRGKTINFASGLILRDTENVLNSFVNKTYNIRSCVADNIFAHKDENELEIECYNPANGNYVGSSYSASEKTIDHAVLYASNKHWIYYTLWERIEILENVAKSIEYNYYELISLLVRETGKTVFDSLNELKQAVDLCRFYTNQLQIDSNADNLPALGLVACVCSWNQPILSFVNSVVSSLVMNNPVIVKPSEFASIVSWVLCHIFYNAGVPNTALQMIVGYGHSIGSYLLSADNIMGIIFDGSLTAAQEVNRIIAQKPYKSRLIANTTNSMNYMFIDASVSLNYALHDAFKASFSYAGQKDESLKILYIQAEIFDKAIKIIRNMIRELNTGDPIDISIDVGPVINKKVQEKILFYIDENKKFGTLIQGSITKEQEKLCFVPPTVIILSSIEHIHQKLNGPVLYVIKTQINAVNNIPKNIKQYGDGLSLMIYSNINTIIKTISRGFPVGNVSTNGMIVDNIIATPIGKSMLSSAGAKKGSPNFIYQLTSENVDINKIHNLHIHSDNRFIINQRFGVLQTVLKNIKNNLKNLGLTTDQYSHLYQLFLSLKEKTLLDKEISLPHIIEEENIMRFQPVGVVGAFAESIESYIKQIIYIVGNGNKLVFHRNKFSLKLKPLLPYGIATYCYSLIDYYQMDLVLIEKHYYRINDIKQSFSQRSGSILPIIEENEDGSYSNFYLVREVVLHRHTNSAL